MIKKIKKNYKNTNQCKLEEGDLLKCWNSRTYAIDFGFSHVVDPGGMIVTCSKRKDKRMFSRVNYVNFIISVH